MITYSTWDLFLLNPIARRNAKIAYNFGLSGCNRVKGKDLFLKEQFLFLKSYPPPFKGEAKNTNERVASSESTPIHLSL